MQVKITHPANATLDIADSLDRWEAEHGQYYGKPCGWREAEVEGPGGLYITAHGRQTDHQARGLIRAVWEEDPPEDVVCGGWLTSGGNLTLVAGLVEYRLGRRHGVRHAAECGPGATWEYQESRCSGVSPDAKDLAGVVA